MIKGQGTRRHNNVKYAANKTKPDNKQHTLTDGGWEQSSEIECLPSTVTSGPHFKNKNNKTMDRTDRRNRDTHDHTY